jgi:hypothetical protein
LDRIRRHHRATVDLALLVHQRTDFGAHVTSEGRIALILGVIGLLERNLEGKWFKLDLFVNILIKKRTPCSSRPGGLPAPL